MINLLWISKSSYLDDTPASLWITNLDLYFAIMRRILKDYTLFLTNNISIFTFVIYLLCVNNEGELSWMVIQRTDDPNMNKGTLKCLE